MDESSLKSHAARFRDLGEIGRGGMGSVHKVYDTVLRRQLAMKTSDPKDPSYPQAARCFQEEAQITSQLDHPNVVPVHDFASGDGALGAHFTMKLVEGETLTAIIRRLQSAPYDYRGIEEFLRTFLKICDALAFAHDRGVVHRDVKPDNVMVGAHGQVYVMDWGLALVGAVPAVSDERKVTLSTAQATRDEPESVTGTYAYMAPEQAWSRGDEIDARTDVFGLGAILYQLLTGEGPSAAPTAVESLRRAQRGHPDPPESRGVWPVLPPGLCRIAMKALSHSRDDRHQTVQELHDEVEEFLRGGGWFETCVFPTGRVVVRQGDRADVAYIIRSGTCEVFREAGAGRVVLRRLSAGGVFGETAVLTGEPRTASVVALDTLTVAVVTRAALERELGEIPWLGVFVRALAERFRELDQQVSTGTGGVP